MEYLAQISLVQSNSEKYTIVEILTILEDYQCHHRQLYNHHSDAADYDVQGSSSYAKTSTTS